MGGTMVQELPKETAAMPLSEFLRDVLRMHDGGDNATQGGVREARATTRGVHSRECYTRTWAFPLFFESCRSCPGWMRGSLFRGGEQTGSDCLGRPSSRRSPVGKLNLLPFFWLWLRCAIVLLGFATIRGATCEALPPRGSMGADALGDREGMDFGGVPTIPGGAATRRDPDGHPEFG